MVLTTAFSPYTAHAKNYNKKSSSKSGSKENPKYASLVMDAETGRILSSRYSTKSLHPASLTKMMTMLLAFEALDRGEVRKDTRIRVSKYAASMVPSKLGLKVGSTIKLEHAIKVLATKSANDIAVAVAEHLGKTESRFAQGMTTRARTIGMKKTRFKNASGLHHPDQVTTARDMALLARYILRRHPHQYKYFSTRSFSYQGKTYKNHNKLLATYQGMDGFKTGYINASGFNLVASAQRNGRRLIGVVFGGRSGATRNAHMAEIMDAGFNKVKNSRTASYVQKATPPTPSQKPTYGVAKEPIARSTPQQVARATRTPVPAPKPAASQKTFSNYASLSALNTQNTSPKITTNRIIGEGDIDMEAQVATATNTTTTSMQLQRSLKAAGNALVTHMGEKTGMNGITSGQINSKNATSSLPHPKDVVGKWAVQIGAFNSRVKTDNALRVAKQRLPAHLQLASPMTVPLNTDKGMIFRARLGGLDESQARQACQIFDDCIAVAPIATRLSSR